MWSGPRLNCASAARCGRVLSFLTRNGFVWMARMGLRTTGPTNASTRGTSRAVRMGVVGSWFGGAFSWRGKPSLAFISGTLNSPGYVNILDEKLLPFTEEKYPNGWRFQQDNAKVHTANYTNEVLYG